jgi:hypothetical protein
VFFIFVFITGVLLIWATGGKGMDIHGLMHDFEWAIINSI